MGNIENEKMSYEDAKELYTKVLLDISRMILEEHSELKIKVSSNLSKNSVNELDLLKKDLK